MFQLNLSDGHVPVLYLFPNKTAPQRKQHLVRHGRNDSERPQRNTLRHDRDTGYVTLPIRRNTPYSAVDLSVADVLGSIHVAHCR